jgi:small subunit ribosomal protein S13
MKPEIKQHKENEEILIRIMSTDIPGNKRVLGGLTNIKGISWAMSNAICTMLKIDKNKKIGQLSKEDIAKITSFMEKPSIPRFMLNRRKDMETGEDKHLIGTTLSLQKEFDIKRLKKIKCYRGLRHSAGQPVRGQRTKSHFRQNKSLGVAKKKK